MLENKAPLEIEGLELYPDALSINAQTALLQVVRDVAEQSPFFEPLSPTGKPMGTYMTNAGDIGWCADVDGGYRYQETHLETGQSWAEMPQAFLDLWNTYTDSSEVPNCCLINHYYGEGSKLGLHKDFGENVDAPVLSISLGDDCIFRMGLTLKPSPTKSFTLSSGSVMVMGGKVARNVYHGVDRILFQSSTLLNEDSGFKNGGRINLTLRCVKFNEGTK